STPAPVLAHLRRALARPRTADVPDVGPDAARAGRRRRTRRRTGARRGTRAGATAGPPRGARRRTRSDPAAVRGCLAVDAGRARLRPRRGRSEEHTSEL